MCDRAADDLVIARDGATVLIDPVSVNYLAGSEIDLKSAPTKWELTLIQPR